MLLTGLKLLSDITNFNDFFIIHKKYLSKTGPMTNGNIE